jgi:hypothetical protein
MAAAVFLSLHTAADIMRAFRWGMSMPASAQFSQSEALSLS